MCRELYVYDIADIEVYHPEVMSTAETKKSADVIKFDEDVKNVAESERFVKANTGHQEHVVEECTFNFVDQNKNMTTSSDKNENVHYVNIDEIMTDRASCITHDVLSESMKQKTLQEHVTHSDDETKEKKKEKKSFFAFGKSKTKQKIKQLKCEQTKEEIMTGQTVFSEKDSSKSKEGDISACSETLLVSKTDSEDGKIQGIPPPTIFADFSMQDGSLNSEAIKSNVVYMESVSSNSVNVSKDSDDISKVNAISDVKKQDETVRSGISSEYDSGSGLSEPPTSQCDKQNLTRNGKDFVIQMKANITDKKKKRWSFNFYDSRKKPQNLDTGIILTNTTGKESEKKHGTFRRFGIRTLSQPKSTDEDSRTSSLPEDEKEHNKALKKSPSTLKSLKIKDLKNNEKMNRRKSTTDVPIDYEESRSILTTVAESKETDRRRRSLITDDELRIEESDVYEGVSLSSLDENDACQKKDSLPHDTVSQKVNVQKNVSYQEETTKKDAFADVNAQQTLEATVEAVNTQAEQSVNPAIPQISAHQSVDFFKDTDVPLGATLQSLKCNIDRAISTGIIPKPVEFALVQQTVKSANDIIDTANTRIPSVRFENDDVVKIEESGNSIKSIQRVDICLSPASESIDVGNDAVISTVSAHKPVTYANDAVINSLKAENYSAGIRDTAIPANTAKQSSDLEKEAVFVPLSAKESSPFTKKIAHPAFINPQTLLVKATDSDSFTDGISRKGNISSVAPSGLIRKKEHTGNVSSGQLNYNERDKGSVAQGIPIPCIHEAVQSFLLRRERIALEREEKLHLKSTEHEKMCPTSIQKTQDKHMLGPENVLNEKQNQKGIVKNTNVNLKNQIPYETGGNEGSLSDKVLNIVSTRLSKIEDIQDIAPDAANKLLYEIKRSNVLSLPITNNTSFRQGKVQICKDVGVQAPDVYLPLDNVFGFRSVPAENRRHVGVQFPETVETCNTTDQSTSKNRVTSFYI